MKKIETSVPEFPIVGIGASAGGLESFSRLLKELPSNSGMAFVLIQHLDPSHVSFLRDALIKTTEMPIYEVADGMRVEPNTVYVIPPAYDLDLLNGCLLLIPRNITPGVPHMPINSFFRALAATSQNKAIGIVLSGTATDGTEGLRAIKNEGGFTFIEDPGVAKFKGMPESALNAGVVDFSLDLAHLALELVRIKDHKYFSSKEEEPFSSLEDVRNFDKILDFIKINLNVDFNEYKPATIKRRLVRRLALLRMDRPEIYLQFLLKDPDEPRRLYEDVLIHVTSFFRDPEAFVSLKQNVFPDIMKNKSDNAPVRMWVAGCSSGEEVYSLVISFLEYLGDTSGRFPIQVFGTDISEKMIEKARTGLFPESINKEISSERLTSFFVRVENGYRISKKVRDLCVFVRHDLARDPPFSRLNLITCRNVLIYFDHNLQKRIFNTFHYCLKQPGYLLLGRTENISAHLQLFLPVDKANKIFIRSSVPSQMQFTNPISQSMIDLKPFERTSMPVKAALDFSKTIDHLLLSDYAPCGVLVNEQMEVIEFRGKTSNFLEQPPGGPETNLIKMIKDGLFVAIKMAVTKAIESGIVVRKDGVSVSRNHESLLCNIIVHPFLKNLTSKENLFLILFEKCQARPERKGFHFFSQKLNQTKIKEEALRSTRLEKELEVTRDYLQALNMEHQITNDSLATANEELISGNEELQSMNEELETAKEELQSINEELTTVNEELQNSNLEVTQVNNDLVNLLNSVEIPIVILDLNRRIRRFTPHARAIMNLLPSDIGRLIDDIRPNVNVQNLEKKIIDAIKNDVVMESEVQDMQSRWYRIQIRPYKTLDNTIDGVVLSLVDINMLRRAVSNAEISGDFARSIVEGIQLPLVVLDEKLKVLSANASFYKIFNVTKDKTENDLMYELGINQWDIPSLDVSLEEMITKRLPFLNIEVEREFQKIGKRIFLLSAQAIQIRDEETGMILLAMEDVTERKNISSERERLLRNAKKAKNQLRLVTDSVSVHLVHLDKNERFLFANKAASEMWGLSFEEMVGKSIADLAGQEIQQMLHPFTARVLKGETVEYEGPLTGKDGIVRTFLNTYTPGTRDANGNVLDFVATGTDITDRKNGEESIKKTNLELAQEKEMRDIFVAALTHDLRTPITSARLCAQMILKQSMAPDQLLSLSHRILSSMDRADGMIRDLLDANRVKAGEKLPLFVEEFDLNSLVKKTLDELSIIHGRRFSFVENAELIGFWDSSAIRRIIENLSTNAIKYGKESASVTVSIKKLKESVELHVHNVGPAIPLNEQNTIFDHHHRSSSVIRGPEVGWGVGLALVQALVDAHKGKVRVTSSDSAGTTFTVTLPLDARQS